MTTTFSSFRRSRMRSASPQFFSARALARSGAEPPALNNNCSGKHAGFIVNYGKAKASEIMSVFIKVQDEVKDKFGVDLEPEIQFIGDWSGERMVRTGKRP